MQGTWNNAQAYYRCTYPAEYARTNHVRHPRTVYLREAEILPALDGWVGQVFSPARLPHTMDALAAAQSPAEVPEVTSLREQITSHDRKLVSYRAALDAGPIPPWWAVGSPKPRGPGSPPGRACAPSPPASRTGG